MLLEDSESFPRGGKIGESVLKRKIEDNLFKTKPKKSKKGKIRKAESESALESSWQTSLILEGTLTYNKIQEGMLVLCCIRHISNFNLQVEFPGLTFGSVMINEISEEFNDQLGQQLKKGNSMIDLESVFQLGQLLPAKIISVKKNEKGHEVQATLNPKIVNSDKIFNSFKRGCLIWANVISKLDHGFALTVGVANCRVFLPFENIDSGVEIVIGQPLFCVVQKAEVDNFATTLSVSAKQKHVNSFKVEDLGLHETIPGMKVDFLVEEVTDCGLKGTFLNNCFGYLDESHFFSKVNLRHAKAGKVLQTYVLFTEPITKITYLTLRDLSILPGPDVAVGKICSSEVTLVTSRGLCLQLEGDKNGFITNKRLLNTFPKDTTDIKKSVKDKYLIGSKRKCRILDYNYMQQLYICTFEKQVLEEKVFNIHDLSVGDTVTVNIEKITSNGLVAKVGQIQGFIPNFHLSDVKYSETIKSKFSPGMKMTAKVLNVTEDNVIFTLKSGLINSENCLKTFEEAAVGDAYTGFVVHVKTDGALVAFYGNVKGWLNSKTLNQNSNVFIDVRQYFFLGQVIPAIYILNCSNKKLQLTLEAPPKLPPVIVKKEVRVGDIIKGTITNVDSEKVEIYLNSQNITATLPLTHLSRDPEISSLIISQLKRNRVFKRLICINYAKEVPIVSRKEYYFHRTNVLKFYKLSDLRTDMQLRCFYESGDNFGIYVTAPIRNYYERIFIPNERIDTKRKYRKKYDVIYTKIVDVDLKLLKVELSISNDTEPPVVAPLDAMLQKMEDYECVAFHAMKNKLGFTQLKRGERVKCKVEEIEKEGCFITLENGVKGFIPENLISSKCKLGAPVQCVVIDYNFAKNYILVSAKKKINEEINEIQDNFIHNYDGLSTAAVVLLVTKFYAVGVLREKAYNKQLIYLPVDKNTKYAFGDKVNIVLHGFLKSKDENKNPDKIAKVIIGIPEKYENVNEHQKRKRTVNRKNIKSMHSKEIVVKEENQTEVEEISIKTCEEERTEKNNLVLSGPSSFYLFDDKKESSSSEDEDNEEAQKPKKKKFSAAERLELAKEEEKRIEKIEKDLADPSTSPQTADQFDRLLLANPNSSELWLKYIAMHVAAAELEKAKAVANKAMSTINPVLIKEKLNIWLAFLNLENSYGTKDSFQKVFEDAVRYNDSLEVYLSVIKMFANSGKLVEMEEKIKKLRGKEKQNSNMWLEVARVYYNLQKFKEARNLKEAALKSILEPQRQFDLIIRFGILEFQLGEFEQAVANFETILETYPSKVNIWIIYVDQLVKKKRIEEARKVLQRAVSQKFALKTMKVLFQKFIAFEEQHGDADAVKIVKKRAVDFVNSLSLK